RGVQFLYFGLTPHASAPYGRFGRKTAHGPLLRLDCDLTSGRYTLPGRAGGQPEVVKPESTQTLHSALDVLDGIWLPLP
ncbi:virulence factor SrfB, partial [Salmonella enterica subsp. enterica serovar Infantis]